MIQKMLNHPEQDFFNKEMTGAQTVRDALQAYKMGNVITWMYCEFSEFVDKKHVDINSKPRLPKSDFLHFFRGINDQMTDSDLAEIFSYYIRNQVLTQTKIIESKSSARHLVQAGTDVNSNPYRGEESGRDKDKRKGMAESQSA